MIWRTQRERSGSTAAKVPTAVRVWVWPREWLRATLEKQP